MQAIATVTDNQNFIDLLFKDSDGLLEVREIGNGDPESLFFSSIDELESYIPPEDKDVFLGISTRKGKRGTKAFVRSTRAIWADYDHVGLEQVKDQLNKAGLPYPSMLVSSGHGVHAYWLLKKRAGKEIEPILKALAAETGGDSRSAEISRVMRMPGTMNLKHDPVSCRVLEINDNAYDVTDISNVLDIEKFEDKTPEYRQIDWNKVVSKVDRPCIQSILQGVPEGQRNWALGRLIKYFQIVEGYSKYKTLSIVLEWNKRNKPSEDNSKIETDFQSYWRGFYKLLGCKIPDPDIQEMLSMHCNKFECPLKASIVELQLDNSVKYNNRLFNRYRSLTGNDLIIYGVLLAEPEGMNTTQLKKELHVRHRKGPCMSRPTMNKSIDNLKGLGLVEVRKKPGRPTFCRIVPQGTYGMGYTLIGNGAINGAIDGRVTPGQFKVYVLLLKYAFGKGEAFPGVLTLAKVMGVEHQTISDHLADLEKARYIKRNYTYTSKGVEKLIIRLLV